MRPVPRAQLPAGVTCALTADGAPPDAETLAEIEKFKTFLRLLRETGDKAAAHAAVYGDAPNPQGA